MTPRRPFSRQELATIRNDLQNAEIEHDDDGNVIQHVYLGTVFALLPSGKYYTPWANSNVDPCPRCHGAGHTRANEHTCEYYDNGAVQHVDGHMLTCCVCHGTGRHGNNCTWCDSLGSREAALDARWYEQAERQLVRIGAALESGEGDPCDLYAVSYSEAEGVM